MPLPTRRWTIVAALLALLWPLAGSVPDGGLAVLAVDLLWVLAFGVDWYLTPEPAGIEVTREAPPAFSVGRALPVRYRWLNGAHRVARCEVREELPGPLMEGPAPKREVRIPARGVVNEWLTLTPRRRGRGTGGTLWLRIRGPLGLVRVTAKIESPWTATVFPDLTEAALRSLPTRQMRRREAGFRSVRRLGEGRVFETLKEWVPGDDTRSIDWKATAKRGKVMARQYEDERRQQVLIVIDAGRMLTAEIDGRPRLESAIDAALQLAYSAVEHDDDVGLLVFADRIQHYLAPRRGRRALRAVVEALATVEGRLLEPDYPAAFAFLASRNRKRALTVFFTDVIDRTASDALMAQVGSLRPRHLPLAVTLRDPSLERTAVAHADTPAQAFERAAAEELLTARAEALTQMRARGVLVLDVPPAQAARSVVERYDQLKRRGAL
ncbi:MAG: DUF58 domain-containing protein [Gemmatimonadota bacterium]